MTPLRASTGVIGGAVLWGVLWCATAMSAAAGAPPARQALPFGLLGVPVSREDVWTLLDAYGRGDRDGVDDLLWSLGTSEPNWTLLIRHATDWLDASPSSRSHAVAAAVVLEIASTRSWAGGPNRMALAFGCGLLREHPPSDFEQTWHQTALGLLRLQDDWSNPSPLGTTLSPDVARRWSRPPDPTGSSAIGRRAAAATPPRRVACEWAGDAQYREYVRARFPGEGLPAFLDALEIENRADWRETLLESGSSPLWMDAAAVDRAIAKGREAVRALPGHLRMDRASAARMLELAPELNPATMTRPARVSLAGSIVVWKGTPAPLLSQWLWQTADAYRRLVSGEALVHVRSEAYVHRPSGRCSRISARATCCSTSWSTCRPKAGTSSR